MAVKGLVGERADGIDDEWANGDVGDEAAIHDVNVYPITACLVDGNDL
jgi:hypothetical protein